jgi:hypothetical protein
MTFKHVLNNETIQPIYINRVERINTPQLEAIKYFTEYFNKTKRGSVLDPIILEPMSYKKIMIMQKYIDVHHEKMIKKNPYHIKSWINYVNDAFTNLAFEITDSNYKKHYIKKGPRQFDFFKKYYSQLFMGPNEISSWLSDIVYTAVNFANENNVDVEIGIENDLRIGTAILNWTNMKNQKIIDEELFLFKNTKFSIIDKTKKECIEDIIKLDKPFLKILYENNSACVNKDRYLPNKNYCGVCRKCFDLSRSNIRHYMFLYNKGKI